MTEQEANVPPKAIRTIILPQGVGILAVARISDFSDGEWRAEAYYQRPGGEPSGHRFRCGFRRNQDQRASELVMRTATAWMQKSSCEHTQIAGFFVSPYENPQAGLIDSEDSPTVRDALLSAALHSDGLLKLVKEKTDFPWLRESCSEAASSLKWVERSPLNAP